MTFRRMRTGVAIAVLAALAAPGRAGQPGYSSEIGTRIQQADPARIPGDLHMSEADRAQAAITDFGVCVILRHRADADRVLALAPFDKDYERRMQGLATSDCLFGGEIRMPLEIMRGALFVALYRVDFAKPGATPGPAPIDYWRDVGGMTQDPQKRGYVGLRQIGDCVVRADPVHARDLVLASPGTRPEGAAFAALMPSIGPCIPTGAQIRFGKSLLVGILAETLFRAETASPQPIAGG